jgi:hypothetical protein
MDPISNVDAIVLLLRQRLLERSRAGAPARADGPVKPRERRVAKTSPLQALAAVDGIDDRQLARALVQSVLAEHFGALMINEPQFQQVVGRVVETLHEEPGAARLLNRMIRELRNSAG